MLHRVGWYYPKYDDPDAIESDDQEPHPTGFQTYKEASEFMESNAFYYSHVDYWDGRKWKEVTGEQPKLPCT